MQTELHHFSIFLSILISVMQCTSCTIPNDRTRPQTRTLNYRFITFMPSCRAPKAFPSLSSSSIISLLHLQSSLHLDLLGT
ncbi:hypothetical protein BT69DRAFT_873594 [Atractiella rhizophila]|nr:hypothetical protein BT69DRAFT_873594 [Atractiella rhizophila]